MAKASVLIAFLASVLSTDGSLSAVTGTPPANASTFWQGETAASPSSLEELRFVYSPDDKGPWLVLVTVREAGGKTPVLCHFAVREVVDPEPENGSFEPGVHGKDFTLEDGFMRLHVADDTDRLEIRPDEGEGALAGLGGSFVRSAAPLSRSRSIARARPVAPAFLPLPATAG